MSRTMTIDTDGNIAVVDADLGYPALNRLLDVQLVEPVDLVDHDKDGRERTVATVWVDEEGLYTQVENPVATRVARHFGAIFSDIGLRGPVAITGGVGPSGETLPLDDDALRVCLRAAADHAGTLAPIRVAPTYWEQVAECVGQGVNVIVAADVPAEDTP